MRKALAVLSLIGLGIVVVVPALAEQDGKSLYEAKCALCHGKDGVAKAGAKGSGNFNDPAWQKASADEAIEKVIADGKGKMKGFKEKLTPEQIKLVAAYLKTLK